MCISSLAGFYCIISNCRGLVKYLQFAEENRIRGTVESVYQLNPNALVVEDEDGMAVQVSLMSICTAFAKYFASGQDKSKAFIDIFSKIKYNESKDFRSGVSPGILCE